MTLLHKKPERILAPTPKFGSSYEVSAHSGPQ